MPMNRLRGHGLQREGAPHDVLGNLVVKGGYVARGGDGRALCSCGSVSGVLPSSYARRAWHRQHKEEVRNAS